MASLRTMAWSGQAVYENSRLKPLPSGSRYEHLQTSHVSNSSKQEVVFCLEGKFVFPSKEMTEANAAPAVLSHFEISLSKRSCQPVKKKLSEIRRDFRSGSHPLSITTGLPRTSKRQNLLPFSPHIRHNSKSLSPQARITVPAASTLLDLAPKSTTKKLSYDLPRFDPHKGDLVDIVVVGGGPAGLAVAQRVSGEGLSVCCIDPAPQNVFPNNYGVWVDEFEAMDLLDCLDCTWASAVVYLDDTRKKVLSRPYGRVNRTRLKSKMLEACISNGVQFYQSKAMNVTHSKDHSSIVCDDGSLIKAAVVLDATGHSRRLVQYDKPFNPGYQIAYGIVAEVDSHPFDLDKMLFMDWRDSHLCHDKNLLAENSKLPTFLYAMPFSANRIFLEETSLVARPGVPMEVIRKRMEARLKHLGINVLSIEEDEKCLIPMGGTLPVIPQRVLGIGGTAGMVHPSTGYMVARTLAAAPILADALVQRLGGPKNSHVRVTNSLSHLNTTEKSTPSQVGQAPLERANIAPCTGDDLSAGVWADLWPLNRQLQREFFCFGMDVLLKLDLAGTRRFFDAFFELDPYHWQGFLSSRLYFTELLGFCLALFVHATNAARLEIMTVGTVPLIKMLSNLSKMKAPKGQKKKA